MHITDPEEREWLQQRVEVKHEQPDREKQKHVLGRLNAAEAFETFLQTKYVGQKRFSLEGGESVIPILDEVLHRRHRPRPRRGRDRHAAPRPAQRAGQRARQELPEDLRRVRGQHGPGQRPGLRRREVPPRRRPARSRNPFRPDAEIAVSLASNPSHLETVNPVLEGIVRAKQDMIDKGEQGFTVLPVLLHGDSAFAGQGVVAETLNLSQLRGYRTGGTVHVVINNQVGFTTSPAAARSSLYSTDVARMIGAPVFHVNGDDPEACVRVARLAVDYRQAFKKDVVIDLVCYRRRGHNEGDDPSMTQPLMYDIIDRKRSVRKLYTEALVGRGDITLAEAEEALKDYRGQLERAFAETHDAQDTSKPAAGHGPAHAAGGRRSTTAITPEILKAIGDAHVSLPAGLHPAPEAAEDARAARGDGQRGRHRLGDGRAARLRLAAHAGRAGPARRPGLAPRHLRAAALGAHRPGDRRGVHAAGQPDRGPGEVLRLRLAAREYAALGFEYGYSVANPKALVLWEAQFGDFVDGAQMVIDEFISSGEAKWGQRSGVVMLLPHGLEGQGPDHSSGRIERFLQLSAENNMTVANCSTPANYFHLLRRQALSDVHRPLVVFTPKSLLRRQGRGQRGRGLHRRRLPAGPARHRGRRRAAGRRRGAPGAAVQRQGRLRPAGPAGVRRAPPTSRSSGSSSSTRCRPSRSARRSSATRTPRTSCGCRRSR